MPGTNRPPTYRLHKARNCAVVTIDGKNHYLGPYWPRTEVMQGIRAALLRWDR
jgi:hypothetical protein